MGNSSQSGTESTSKQTEQKFKQSIQTYNEILRSLSVFCNDDQFPLNIFRQKSDASSDHQTIDLLLPKMRSEDFIMFVIKLIWNNRTSIPRHEVTKIFYDCCQFDLKQALIENMNPTELSTLDNQCFSALTNSIGTNTTSDINQEQFYQWIRGQFPTLFLGFEMWLRKNSTSVSNKNSQETSASTCVLLKMNNILNSTLIWLLTHNIPIIYLSADKSCTNFLERMSSILYDRMWDHLYDSHRDGLSLNRFQHHTFGYKGPTIILFDVSDGYLFCLCCDEEFRESPKHFGGIQACLLQLKPVFKLVLEGPNTIFMNIKFRGLSAPGLFIGRDLAHTFLNIDGDFFKVKHLNGEGRLVAIDIWGAGGSKSADEQNSLRQWETTQVEKANKAKRSYGEEEAILNMAGITTRHAQEQL